MNKMMKAVYIYIVEKPTGRSQLNFNTDHRNIYIQGNIRQIDRQVGRGIYKVLTKKREKLNRVFATHSNFIIPIFLQPDA